MIDIGEIKNMSIEERIKLVESIWDSIAEDTSPEGIAKPKAEKEEILKRLNEFKNNNQITYSWDEVKTYALEH